MTNSHASCVASFWNGVLGVKDNDFHSDNFNMETSQGQQPECIRCNVNQAQAVIGREYMGTMPETIFKERIICSCNHNCNCTSDCDTQTKNNSLCNGKRDNSNIASSNTKVLETTTNESIEYVPNTKWENSSPMDSSGEFICANDQILLKESVLKKPPNTSSSKYSACLLNVNNSSSKALQTFEEQGNSYSVFADFINVSLPYLIRFSILLAFLANPSVTSASTHSTFASIGSQAFWSPCPKNFSSARFIYVRHPKICSVFYVCHKMRFWRLSCDTPNTVFSLKHKVCVWEDSSLDDCTPDLKPGQSGPQYQEDVNASNKVRGRDRKTKRRGNKKKKRPVGYFMHNFKRTRSKTSVEPPSRISNKVNRKNEIVQARRPHNSMNLARKMKKERLTRVMHSSTNVSRGNNYLSLTKRTKLSRKRNSPMYQNRQNTIQQSRKLKQKSKPKQLLRRTSIKHENIWQKHITPKGKTLPRPKVRNIQTVKGINSYAETKRRFSSKSLSMMRSVTVPSTRKMIQDVASERIDITKWPHASQDIKRIDSTTHYQGDPSMELDSNESPSQSGASRESTERTGIWWVGKDKEIDIFPTDEISKETKLNRNSNRNPFLINSQQKLRNPSHSKRRGQTRFFLDRRQRFQRRFQTPHKKNSNLKRKEIPRRTLSQLGRFNRTRFGVRTYNLLDDNGKEVISSMPSNNLDLGSVNNLQAPHSTSIPPIHPPTQPEPPRVRKTNIGRNRSGVKGSLQSRLKFDASDNPTLMQRFLYKLKQIASMVNQSHLDGSYVPGQGMQLNQNIPSLRIHTDDNNIQIHGIGQDYENSRKPKTQSNNVIWTQRVQQENDSVILDPSLKIQKIEHNVQDLKIQKDNNNVRGHYLRLEIDNDNNLNLKQLNNSNILDNSVRVQPNHDNIWSPKVQPHTDNTKSLRTELKNGIIWGLRDESNHGNIQLHRLRGQPNHDNIWSPKVQPHTDNTKSIRTELKNGIIWGLRDESNHGNIQLHRLRGQPDSDNIHNQRERKDHNNILGLKETTLINPKKNPAFVDFGHQSTSNPFENIRLTTKSPKIDTENIDFIPLGQLQASEWTAKGFPVSPEINNGHSGIPWQQTIPTRISKLHENFDSLDPNRQRENNSNQRNRLHGNHRHNGNSVVQDQQMADIREHHPQQQYIQRQQKRFQNQGSPSRKPKEHQQIKKRRNEKDDHDVSFIFQNLNQSPFPQMRTSHPRRKQLQKYPTQDQRRRQNLRHQNPRQPIDFFHSLKPSTPVPRGAPNRSNHDARPKSKNRTRFFHSSTVPPRRRIESNRIPRQHGTRKHGQPQRKTQRKPSQSQQETKQKESYIDRYIKWKRLLREREEKRREKLKSLRTTQPPRRFLYGHRRTTPTLSHQTKHGRGLLQQRYERLRNLRNQPKRHLNFHQYSKRTRDTRRNRQQYPREPRETKKFGFRQTIHDNLSIRNKFYNRHYLPRNNYNPYDLKSNIWNRLEYPKWIYSWHQRLPPSRFDTTKSRERTTQTNFFNQRWTNDQQPRRTRPWHIYRSTTQATVITRKDYETMTQPTEPVIKSTTTTTAATTTTTTTATTTTTSRTPSTTPQPFVNETASKVVTTKPSRISDLLKRYEDTCGIMASPLIIGGWRSRSGQWPWQASLQIVTSTTTWHRCGAVLIHERWVLTAAHCMEGKFFPQHAVFVRVAGQEKQYDIQVGFCLEFKGPFYGDIRNWRVVMADYDLEQVSGKEIYRHVVRIVSHPGYVRVSNFPNDVALLELDRPVDMTSGEVQTACLPGDDMPLAAGTQCWISGWGETRGSGGQENAMNEVAVEVIALDQCKDMWGRVDIEVLDSQVCLGTGEIGACYGDSGGPLMCEQNGRFYVSGVMSWLINNCSAHNFPNVFTRLPAYMDWVSEQIETFESISLP